MPSAISRFPQLNLDPTRIEDLVIRGMFEEMLGWLRGLQLELARLKEDRVDPAMVGVALAWAYCQYTAGVPSVTSGFNVASITDTGVGDAKLVFTTALPNANYATFVSAYSVLASDDQSHPYAQATTDVDVAIRVGGAASDTDFAVVCMGK
jgi:hypothetical protein